MATAVIMPKQGQSVETCIITKWFRSRGENVATGDILLSYETDKAAFDLESPAEGILLDIFFGEGAEVPVLSNIAVIGKSGEATESFKSGQAVVATAAAAIAKETDIKASSPLSGDNGPGDDVPLSGIRISPRARKLAQDKGVDFRNIAGSGPNGRIVAADIEKVKAVVKVTKTSGSSSGSEFSEQPLSNMRKLISKAMHASLQNSAQLTHHMSADVRRLLETRRKIKEKRATDKTQPDITLNDMICWCVIRALEIFPEANSHFLDDRIRTFHKVHLGFAVDTQRGLMVPVVKNAGDLDLIKLSEELKSAADACKKGSITPELIQSSAATFTVSNLGNYGVEMFTPVINLPQVGILGICTIINRPADLGNNIFGFAPYIGLSLTYDHRAIDGGPATLFLREIKEQIEAFSY
jgi:pyruvate dehydrogenase E2 component (dihydrolipoamide acetyltransferase)